MVTMQEVEDQLKKLGIRPNFWIKPEIRELPRILVPGERLMAVAPGWYNGGFALLCCTDQRVLLIDKKFLFLTLEDFRYDMIAEVMYQYRLLDASVSLTYAAKSLDFKSWNQGKLRDLATYIQQRVMEVRRYHVYNQSPFDYIQTPVPTPQPAPPASGLQFPVQPQPAPARNPYQIRPYLRRRVSRFVTSSQLAR